MIASGPCSARTARELDQSTRPKRSTRRVAPSLSTAARCRLSWAMVSTRACWAAAERGGPIRRSNFTRRVWIPATRAAGVEGLRFHDLRHTAATLAVAAGASTRELMVRMGHSSSAAALRYQHVMVGRDAAIAAALDDLVQAATARSEDSAATGSGTRVARTGQHRRTGDHR